MVRFELAPLDEVAFVMVRDNATQMQARFDDILLKRNKFICLNDDMNASNINPKVTSSKPSRNGFGYSAGGSVGQAQGMRGSSQTRCSGSPPQTRCTSRHVAIWAWDEGDGKGRCGCHPVNRAVALFSLKTRKSRLYIVATREGKCDTAMSGTSSAGTF